jgi:hypothetical protein
MHLFAGLLWIGFAAMAHGCAASAWAIERPNVPVSRADDPSVSRTAVVAIVVTVIARREAGIADQPPWQPQAKGACLVGNGLCRTGDTAGTDTSQRTSDARPVAVRRFQPLRNLFRGARL